jgi:hypothetical protein
MGIRRWRTLFVFFGILIVLGIGLCLLFFRAPVIIVTDAPFNALYGFRRSQIKSIEISLTLLRRVKPVLIAENAGPDMVVFTVEEFEPSPYCVLFPYRYNEGAGRYAEQFPHVPVFILGGRNQDPQIEGTIFVGTDVRTDLYRAGQCAGIIAQNDGKEILFFQNEVISAENQDAFLVGLREQGSEKVPKYLSITENYSDNQSISCVIMNGQAASFLDQNTEIPVILFSWVDPDLTATSVKLIFDDSPWALATRVVNMIPGENGGRFIPSAILIPGRRITNAGISYHLKKVLNN